MTQNAPSKVYGDPDSAYIKVFPRSAGNFGICSISGMSYKDTSHIDDMINQIERHVDGVVHTTMCFEDWVCPKCKCTYSTVDEAEKCDCDSD